MKIVVCDTGPILHLREADCLSLLREAGSIYIPPAVDTEMVRLDQHWMPERPSWIQRVPLDSTHVEDARTWLQADLLDPGEAQALALADQIGADWLLLWISGRVLEAAHRELERIFPLSD